MVLNSLSPELIHAIAERSGPFSSFDLAITCKAHWELCKTLIQKHKQRFAENRVIDAHDSTWPRTNLILWDKLKEILDDPDVGEYVRDLSLPSSRAIYLDGNAANDHQLTDQSPKLPQEDIDRFAEAGNQLRNLLRGSAVGEFVPRDNEWNEHLFEGSSEPIILMLIHRLTYLKTFRFTVLELSIVFRCVAAIAVAYNDPVLAPQLPFQHLTTVAVAHWDTEGSTNLSWCLAFCAIPSVRNFVATAMGGDGGNDDFPVEDAPDSNVTELVFSYSRFDNSGIEAIVQKTPVLERFSYEAAGAIVDESVMITPKRDLDALVRHLGDTLQHLLYETPEYGDEVSILLWFEEKEQHAKIGHHAG